MATAHEPYLKAAGSDRMAPYYDLMARLGMRERRIKGRVLDLARIAPGGRMLDVGCGTGTLVLMARRRYPNATVIGVDGDPTILSIARRKAARAGASVQFDEGMAYALPYADGSFDAVVSTLTFHHLTPDQQERALAEVQRVLRPGGRLVIADLTRRGGRMGLLHRLLSVLMPRHGGHGGAHHAHGSTTEEHHPSPEAHHDAPEHPEAAPPDHMRRTASLARLLSAHDWRIVTPVERFTSVMGTIAVYALTRPE
jgi:ubiquinone/menaquinone biosynthesis C-methylase UbiE